MPSGVKHRRLFLTRNTGVCIAAKQMNTMNNFVSETCSSCWAASREFSAIQGKSNIFSEVILNKPGAIQINIHHHSLRYSIIISVVSEQRSNVFQGNTGGSKTVQRQPQVQDRLSSIGTAMQRSSAASWDAEHSRSVPLGSEGAAGSRQAGGNIRHPPMDQIYLKHEHLRPLLEMSQLCATQRRCWCKPGLPCHGRRDTQGVHATLFKLHLQYQTSGKKAPF